MPSSVAELRALVERRWHGAIAHAGSAVRAGSPTGMPALDALLAPRGVPKGQLTEIFGAASSGKTTLALALLAACTREGGIGAYIDPAGGFFAPGAAAAGIDLRRVIVVRPRDEAAARRAVDALVRGGACGVVALDCGEWPQILQTQHCTRLVAQAEKTGTVLLVISGGTNAAVASFASLRLRAHGLAPLWQAGGAGGGRLAGCVATIDIAKARSASPGRSVVFEAAIPDVAGTYTCEPKCSVPSERSELGETLSL